MDEKITKIEEFVKPLMGFEPAHEYDHVDRARKWAIIIAKAEGYQNLELVEAAALMHDIGLSKGRKGHGLAGAEMAAEFLEQNKLFSKEEIEEAKHAITYHDSNRQGELTPLLKIVRDADMMEIFGPIGLKRGMEFGIFNKKPFYNNENLKGESWGYSAADFDKWFDIGKNQGDTIVDLLNFHISCFDNLNTEKAKELAKPGIEYIRSYILELEKQVTLLDK